MTSKYTFKQEYSGLDVSFGSTTPSTITMEIHGEVTLSELLSRFEEFLRGSGFHFNGVLDIVSVDDIKIDDTDEDEENNNNNNYLYGEPTVTFGSIDDNMNINLDCDLSSDTFVVNTEAHSPYYYDSDRNK